RGCRTDFETARELSVSVVANARRSRRCALPVACPRVGAASRILGGRAMNGVLEVTADHSVIAAPRSPLIAGSPLDDRAFADLRPRAILDGCKWDPQVGDVTTLARFPLLMQRATWEQLARWAEQLTVEALAAEQEILSRPALLDELGLPRAIRRLLRRAGEIP